MPGWTSNAPVQVNGGVHFHGRHSTPLALPTSAPSSPTQSESSAVLWSIGKALLVLAGACVALPLAAALLGAILAGGLLAGGLFIGVFTFIFVLVISFWVTARFAELVLLVERRIRGPRQLIYVPSFMQPTYDTTPILESDYDSDSITTTGTSSAPVHTRRAR